MCSSSSRAPVGDHLLVPWKHLHLLSVVRMIEAVLIAVGVVIGALGASVLLWSRLNKMRRNRDYLLEEVKAWKAAFFDMSRIARNSP